MEDVLNFDVISESMNNIEIADHTINSILSMIYLYDEEDNQIFNAVEIFDPYHDIINASDVTSLESLWDNLKSILMKILNYLKDVISRFYQTLYNFMLNFFKEIATIDVFELPTNQEEIKEKAEDKIDMIKNQAWGSTLQAIRNYKTTVSSVIIEQIKNKERMNILSLLYEMFIIDNGKHYLNPSSSLCEYMKFVNSHYPDVMLDFIKNPITDDSYEHIYETYEILHSLSQNLYNDFSEIFELKPTINVIPNAYIDKIKYKDRLNGLVYVDYKPEIQLIIATIKNALSKKITIPLIEIINAFLTGYKMKEIQNQTYDEFIVSQNKLAKSLQTIKNVINHKSKQTLDQLKIMDNRPNQIIKNTNRYVKTKFKNPEFVDFVMMFRIYQKVVKVIRKSYFYNSILIRIIKKDFSAFNKTCSKIEQIRLQRIKQLAPH